MLLHDMARLLGRLRQDVKKRSHALATKDHPAVISIRLDRIVDGRLGKRGLEPQRLFEAFGDIDKLHFAILKKIRLTTHASSILSRCGWLQCVQKCDEEL